MSSYGCTKVTQKEYEIPLQANFHRKLSVRLQIYCLYFGDVLLSKTEKFGKLRLTKQELTFGLI